MLSEVGSSPVEVSATLSAARLGTPAPVSCAPPVSAEFSQPRPLLPRLKHGQVPSLASPKQKGAKGGDQLNVVGSEAMPLATTCSAKLPEGSVNGTRNSVETGVAPVQMLVVL